uniref:Vesicular, overexpressed in cancer, prosurvival protein 1 n=1 Tax=Panagrellus redivivus TaxID=6233 RepID=A0A7E4W0X4_PANRE
MPDMVPSDSRMVDDYQADDDVLYCPAKLNGQKCPGDDSVFIYHECCDDSSPNCCARNRLWVNIFLVSMTFVILSLIVAALWRFVCCPDSSNGTGLKYKLSSVGIQGFSTVDKKLINAESA